MFDFAIHELEEKKLLEFLSFLILLLYNVNVISITIMITLQILKF